MSKTVEFRVKPVTRWIVTRHDRYADGGPDNGARQIGGEHASEEVAYEIGYALASEEDRKRPAGDESVIYPQPPGSAQMVQVDEGALNRAIFHTPGCAALDIHPIRDQDCTCGATAKAAQAA